MSEILDTSSVYTKCPSCGIHTAKEELVWNGGVCEDCYLSDDWDDYWEDSWDDYWEDSWDDDWDEC